MGMKRTAIIVALALLFAVQAAPDTIDGLPLHIKKLSDRAIRLWVGDYLSSTAVVALSARDGIVVVDTTMQAGIDKELRRVIAREFGREDFKYLINTHEHWDHTFGNQVYADCEIIAHAYCPEGMQSIYEDQLQFMVAHINDWAAQLETELKAVEAGTEEAKKLEEQLKSARITLRDLGSDFKLTLPTKTFTDQMRLDLGDMTLELYYAGGVHSPSDIFIFIPEERLLLTGDVMADAWLNETPGCLASFALQQGVERDIPLLLKNWGSLVARRGEIADLVPGHWNGDISFEGFERRYNYVKTLWDGINQAVEDGQTLAEIRGNFDLQTRFPELVGSPGITSRNHWVSVSSVWCDITGAESAATALGRLIYIQNLDAEDAVAQIKAARASGSNKYYFEEPEFNALGYELLNEDRRYQDAVNVFKLNVELYPQSWNAYDSLGEAYVAGGDNEMAIRCYEKSLEINPDSENGKQMLERLKSAQN